jgi:predicted GTPase
LEEAEKEADIIVWDGGNNDLPFYKPDLHIVVADPHRAGHEITYHPGEANLRMANVVIINKVDTADPKNVEQVKENIRNVNPNATILDAASPITADKPELIKGRHVLVIEDGPTLTHGNMPYGAGTIMATRFGASEIVDPKPYATGSIRETYKKYTHLGTILPAIGYGEKQIAELKETIDRTPCDVVVIGTPIDLRRVMTINKPTVRVKYELQVLGPVSLEQILEKLLQRGKG